jgi:hypothetical protein
MYLKSLNTFLNKSNENGTRNTPVRDNSYYRHNHHNISAQVSISIIFYNTYGNRSIRGYPIYQKGSCYRLTTI